MIQENKVDIVVIPTTFEHHCSICETLLVKIEPRLHTDYWFCTKCNLNFEISHMGQFLRSFRPTQNVIIQTNPGE